MTTYRTVRLVLHLGRKQTAYALMLRTSRGQDLFDRRLSSGALPQRTDPDQPRDVLDLLERVLHDLRRRHGVTDPAQQSGAPGGGGGRPDDDLEDTLPLYVVSRDGQRVDYDGRPV